MRPMIGMMTSPTSEVDDLAEGRADDHADGEIRLTLPRMGELLEFLEHWFSPLLSSAVELRVARPAKQGETVTGTEKSSVDGRTACSVLLDRHVELLGEHEGVGRGRQ